jgi:hypothetical protein
VALPLNLANYQAIIAPGASLSAPVSIGAQRLVGIVVPAGWVAGVLTFQTSIDGVNWNEVYDIAGDEIQVAASATAAGAFVAIDPTIWQGVNMLTVRSGTLASPVVQTGGATVTLVTRAFEY